MNLFFSPRSDLTLWFDFLEKIKFFSFLKAVIIVILGYFLARYLGVGARKISRNHLGTHQALLLERVIFYGVFILCCLTALQEMGFSLSILLGATGVVSLALGFASQTSAANLISGLFLVFERPFQVGDWIQIDSLIGEIYSMDALSVKLRTAQNTFVRIPNETLIKSTVTNLSKFEYRRLDILLGVDYTQKIDTISALLQTLAQENSLCLSEPPPFVHFENFGESAINLRFSVCIKQEDFPQVKNQLPVEIHEKFKKNGINLPFPARVIYMHHEKSEK
jgi:small-conductance mechanosensitive channel